MYFFKRILSTCISLWILTSIVFFTLRLAPGGPFDGERALPQEVLESINREYGLDLPVYQQYLRWLGGVLHFDFNESFQYAGKSVVSILQESAPISAMLGITALLTSIFLGVMFGLYAAYFPKNRLNTFINLLISSGINLPSYLIASILVMIFSIELNWLPPALWGEPGAWILPTFTLAIKPIAMITKLIKTSALGVMNQDYIRTAYAKGLSQRAVMIKHVLKNAFLPTLTMLGPIAANLLTGSFLVESVFQLPGIGRHFVSAVLNRDYPLVMGVTLLYGALLMLLNLIVDLSYSVLDPRIET